MGDIDTAVLKTIVDTAHDHFFIVEASGRILDVSPGSAAVYGLSSEELCATTVQDLVERGVLSPSVTMEVIRTGQAAQVMQHTGTGRRVIAEAHPVFVDGKLERIVSRSMDLTDLQLLQDEYTLLQRRFSEHLKRGGSASLGDDLELDNLEVRSGVMREVALLIKRVAPTDATVLMLGESGVGKTAFARQLHRWSARHDGPFIDVNCAAIPEALFESEMFGYQPGAFSGAARQGKAGVLEMADGGTLFLDEIGELPLAMQTKLLKVIQDGRVTRLGDTQARRVDFRLVVATNQDLAARVEGGAFRLDLYYRLNVIPLTLPPLRERREDVPGLVELQLERLNRRYGRTKVLHPSVWPELMGRDWPGNVRELENWMERAWLAAPDEVIGAPGNDALHAGLQRGPSIDAPPAGLAELTEGQTLKQALEVHERQILESLSRQATSTYGLAERLGISQPSVVRKLRKHGLRIGAGQKTLQHPAGAG
ncbi:PAS domain S-box-containing protein/TyrR family helix-turn-helix domain-containing protein [Modicisalibacter ilicicola DSM 19980]|uniref:HTH-type transcriptional regulatory protein TyrR n=1 Tax=Modicisalibacter ilicicola DSM 19980 TaxID=1121942 RepID=A0A1M4T7X9_9GAMM|nr:sigma 54-interacting transcriptional regulator [Halomonas ilicicola]SHE40561.1 PAS domain S-box-containing protein/TyrR family helix-turn-helix domain-containing protein [Halomonas ilicicola DSM 19980]